VNDREQASAKEFLGAIAKHTLECGISKLNGAVLPEDRDQFAGGVEKSRKLLSSQLDPGLTRHSLGHELVASRAGKAESLPPAKILNPSKGGLEVQVVLRPLHYGFYLH
jgi:hypothetical protein